jgi:signal transduction histidine kinase
VTRRLLLGYLGVTLFVLLSLEIPLGLQNQRSERRNLTANVSHDAMALALDAEDAVLAPTKRALNVLAARAAGYTDKTGGRVVIADVRGRALIDTSGRVRGAESFASRPEIVAALAGHYPSGVRTSKTLHERLLYVAVPIAAEGKVRGAVRITYPLSAVDARITRYWLILGLIGGVVLIGAALVGLGAARFVTRPLQRLEEAAAAVGDGRLETRADVGGGPPEVKSLAAVFNGTVAKLERLVHSQDEFVADASHELRTPLTALRLRLENLPEGADRDAALRETLRLSGLVDSLLALARADSAGDGTERVDAAAIVRDRVDAWLPVVAEHDVVLRADVDDRLTVRSLPGRLAQVLDNLVSNALEVSPPGTTITIAGRTVASWVELHVIDEGPGLTAEQRERAFDRFWRAGSGAGGSGLGLAIVRRLVVADGGEVELLAASGGGIDAVVRLRTSPV